MTPNEMDALVSRLLKFHDTIVEECARVAASFHAFEVADAIRALKDEEPK